MSEGWPRVRWRLVLLKKDAAADFEAEAGDAGLGPWAMLAQARYRMAGMSPSSTGAGKGLSTLRDAPHPHDLPQCQGRGKLLGDPLFSEGPARRHSAAGSTHPKALGGEEPPSHEGAALWRTPRFYRPSFWC